MIMRILELEVIDTGKYVFSQQLLSNMAYIVIT